MIKRKYPDFIFQVRSGSTRLPQKMLKPFSNNLTIPEILIEKIQKSFPTARIIIATTNSPNDDVLAKKLGEYNVELFRGSENNVLQRFIDAGEKYEVETFVRVCADNPFLDMKLARETIEHWTDDMDYLTYQINQSPSMKTGLGFFIEMSKISTLKKVAHQTQLPLYLEHVTNYIYEHPEKFNVTWMDSPRLISDNYDIRLTVDTFGDYIIAKDTYLNTINKSYEEVIEYVISKGYLEDMVKIANENKK